MRANPSLLLLAVLAAAGLAAASNAIAAAGDRKEPSCSELTSERAAILQETKAITARVNSKNGELRETSDALSAAKAAARQRELTRRAEGLRRELTVLLDREHESSDRLGRIESQIAKSCRKRGGK